MDMSFPSACSFVLPDENKFSKCTILSTATVGVLRTEASHSLHNMPERSDCVEQICTARLIVVLFFFTAFTPWCSR